MEGNPARHRPNFTLAMMPFAPCTVHCLTGVPGPGALQVAVCLPASAPGLSWSILRMVESSVTPWNSPAVAILGNALLIVFLLITVHGILVPELAALVTSSDPSLF